VHTGEHKTVADDIAWLLERVAPRWENWVRRCVIQEIALMLKQDKSEAQNAGFFNDSGSLTSLVQQHCELWATSL
jgi:carboxylate-amine ligase